MTRIGVSESDHHLRRRGGRSGRPSSAFTLVELVVVMVVVGVLAASAAPVVNRLGEARQRVAVQTLARDVSYARERATATGARCWAVFTLPYRWAVMEEEVGSTDPTSATWITDPATGDLFERDLRTDFGDVRIISANFGGSRVVGFDWRGKPWTKTLKELPEKGVTELSGGHRIEVSAETGHVEAVSP